MQQAIADCGPRGERRLERAHRADRRVGRALDPQPLRGAPHRHREGQPEADGAVHGDPLHVLDGLGLPRDAVQDQGDQLLDHLGLLDQRALHRQRRRADPVGQAGHRLRRRRRGARLDALVPLRRHGRDEHEVQRRRPRPRSRAFDADRDGFVIAGGGGMVVLEELEHARARGAKIYAEVTGYGATSDGHDMVAPSGVGRRAGDAAGALDAAGNRAASATSTPTAPRRRSATSARSRRSAGSSARARSPPISSTKSMTGHARARPARRRRSTAC